MCLGVVKSGSPRLKSKTILPSVFSCLAFAPAASVADGWTAAAIFEIGSMMVVSFCVQGFRRLLYDECSLRLAFGWPFQRRDAPDSAARTLNEKRGTIMVYLSRI